MCMRGWRVEGGGWSERRQEHLGMKGSAFATRHPPPSTLHPLPSTLHPPPSTLARQSLPANRHVSLEACDFLRVHILPDLAPESLDRAIWTVLLELVLHARTDARDEQDLLLARRVEID